ncbi:MAG: RHS repeat domain-containing protein [Winogradskyella sp.]
MIKPQCEFDYYPFGSLLPKRHGSTDTYRYGFNGKEKDDEVKGEGNSYDFGARMYDPRIGRWFKTDPEFFKQPGKSSYKSFNNNPLLYIDPDGNTEWLITKVVNYKTNTTHIRFEVVDADKLDKKLVRTLNNNGYVKKHWEFRDIIKMQTITINEDGTVVDSEPTTSYNLKYTRSKHFDWVPYVPNIDTKGSAPAMTVKDGYVFTTTSGKEGWALPNKKDRNSDADIKEIDGEPIMLLTQLARNRTKFKPTKMTPENVAKQAKKWLTKIFDEAEVNYYAEYGEEGLVTTTNKGEPKVLVTYRVTTGGVNKIKINGVTSINANKKTKDTLVPQSQASKIHKELEEKFLEDSKKEIKKSN